MKFLSLIFVFSFFNLQAAEVLKFKASYTVPTLTTEEEVLSSFELVDYTVTKNDPGSEFPASLKYELPYEMTGIDHQTVEMNLMIEQLPFRVFEGEKAIALCHGLWNQMKCDVRFKKLDFDFSNIELDLATRGFSGQDMQMRIDILKRFSGDPIGKSLVTAP